MELGPDEAEARRGHVGAFLLTSLRTAAGRYAMAADTFSGEVEMRRGCSFWELEHEDQDYTLADRVVEMTEFSQSSEGYAAAALIVAAISKVSPGRVYRTAWKCLDAWRRRNPAKEAPAMPIDLCMACVTWLVLNGRATVAAVMLLCFTGCLRVRKLWR